MQSIRIGTPRGMRRTGCTVGEFIRGVGAVFIIFFLLYLVFHFIHDVSHPEFEIASLMMAEDQKAEAELQRHRRPIDQNRDRHVLFAVVANQRRDRSVPAEEAMASLESDSMKAGGKLRTILINVNENEHYLHSVRRIGASFPNFVYKHAPPTQDLSTRVGRQGTWGTVHTDDFQRTDIYLRALRTIQPLCQDYYVVLEDDMRWCPNALDQYLLPAIRLADEQLKEGFTSLRFGPGAGGVVLECAHIEDTIEYLEKRFHDGPHHLLLGALWSRDEATKEEFQHQLANDWFQKTDGRIAATLKFNLLEAQEEKVVPGKVYEALSKRDRAANPRCGDYMFQRQIWPDENFNLIDCGEHALTPCPRSPHQHRLVEENVNRFRALWFSRRKLSDPYHVEQFKQFESRTPLWVLFFTFTGSVACVICLGLFILRILRPDWWNTLCMVWFMSNGTKAA